MADGQASVDDTFLSPTDLQRLRAAAQARGRLSLDDLKRTLPIELLSTEQIARVVGELEDAAIDIEIDPTLMRPSHKAAPTLDSGFRIAANDQDAAYTHAQPFPSPRKAAASASRVSARRAEPVTDNRWTSPLVIGLIFLVCASLTYIASRLV
jgi:hypothetical protein